MAEPATDLYGGLDIDRIVRGAMPGGGVDTGAAREGVTQAARSEAAAKAPILDRVVSDMETDKVRIHKAHDAIDPVDLKPWDADKNREKFSTDPLAAMGSFASIAALVASAFTRQPMINAMTGMGAAITAINQKNDKDYDRAYDAYKTNIDTAVKQHSIQRQAYDDAIKLMNTDRTAGVAELEATAAKFQDKKALALIEAGMIPELIQYKESERRAYQGMMPLVQQFEQFNVRKQLLSLDPDYQSSDPARKRAAIRRVQDERGGWMTPEQEVWQNYKKENPDASSSDQMKFLETLRGLKKPYRRHAEAMSEEQAIKQHVADGMPEEDARNFVRASYDVAAEEDIRQYTHLVGQQPSEEEKKTIRKSVKDTGISAAIRDAKMEVAVEKIKAIRAQGREPTPEERLRILQEVEAKPTKVSGSAMVQQKARAVEELVQGGMSRADAIRKVEEKGPTFKDTDKLRSHIDMFDISADRIDKALGVLETHIGSAGIAGRATRLAERVGNILGSNSTDREQFMRDVQYLRMLGARLLNDTSARPLAAQIKQVDDIIGGLNLGDTTANTIRSLQEVKEIYKQMKTNTMSRLQGTWVPGGPPAQGQIAPMPSPGVGLGGGAQPWLNDPVVK